MKGRKGENRRDQSGSNRRESKKKREKINSPLWIS
jgi:hypothetical protein